MREAEAHTAVELIVNGSTRRIEADPSTPLLYLLRNDLGLSAAKFGCGLEQCGACTVLVEGEPTLSCSSPAGSFAGKQITTLEGLAGSATLHRVQEAFLVEQAAQCGYCIPGIVVSAVALLEHDPAPGPADVKQALEPHLCRCGTHAAIVRAVLRAASTETAA